VYVEEERGKTNGSNLPSHTNANNNNDHLLGIVDTCGAENKHTPVFENERQQSHSVNENTEVGTVSGLSKDFYSLKTK
jgi:hypothetical protein